MMRPNAEAQTPHAAPCAYPRLLASTVVPATDTRTPYAGRLTEARDGPQAARGRPGEVVAIATRPGTDTRLTEHGEPRRMQEMARAAGMRPLVVAFIGVDGQMRALAR